MAALGSSFRSASAWTPVRWSSALKVFATTTQIMAGFVSVCFEPLISRESPAIPRYVCGTKVSSATRMRYNQPMIKLTKAELDVGIVASDADATCAFYRDVLRLAELPSAPIGPG